MRSFSLAVLLVLVPFQNKVSERVRVSKILDIENAKSNIIRVAPPYDRFEPCGEYLLIASRSDQEDGVKMAYYEGEDLKDGNKEVVRYSRFDQLSVEIDEKLKSPEIILRLVAPPQPIFIYRMSRKDYETMPCLPKVQKRAGKKNR